MERLGCCADQPALPEAEPVGNTLADASRREGIHRHRARGSPMDEDPRPVLPATDEQPRDAGSWSSPHRSGRWYRPHARPHRPFMRSKSLSRSRMSTPGCSVACHPCSFRPNRWRALPCPASACLRRSLATACTVRPSAAARRLSSRRIPSSSINVVLAMHQSVGLRHLDVNAHHQDTMGAAPPGGRASQTSRGRSPSTMIRHRIRPCRRS